MIIRRVHPDAEAPLQLPAQQDQLDSLYRPDATDWLRINLVSSIDGSAAGADGTSASLTGGADRKVLGAIRRASDIVLVGASSFSAEGYVLPKTAPLAVVTASGDLGGHAIASAVDRGRLLVICPPSASGRVRETLTVDGVEIVEVDIPAAATIIAVLRHRGFSSIVCEGGPKLAGSLVAGALVDELCLTTSPALGGPALPLLGSGRVDQVSVELRQLLVDDSGFSYARWTLPRSRR